jgi:hypothetical protein
MQQFSYNGLKRVSIRLLEKQLRSVGHAGDIEEETSTTGLAGSTSRSTLKRGGIASVYLRRSFLCFAAELSMLQRDFPFPYRWLLSCLSDNCLYSDHEEL